MNARSLRRLMYCLVHEWTLLWLSSNFFVFSTSISGEGEHSHNRGLRRAQLTLELAVSFAYRARRERKQIFFSVHRDVFCQRLIWLSFFEELHTFYSHINVNWVIQSASHVQIQREVEKKLRSNWLSQRITRFASLTGVDDVLLIDISRWCSHTLSVSCTSLSIFIEGKKHRNTTQWQRTECER